MTPEQFRHHAHELVDWMADYLRDVGKRPVVPAVAPGEIRRALPAEPPAAGEPFEAIAADFRELILPGMTHWNHPGWFGYFPANHSPPSILAEMLTATLGAQCMSWQTSPAATELEQVVMEWLRGMLALPADFTGVIQDTASTASLVALLTARDRRGTDPRMLTVYASTEAHSSITKGARLAGFAPEHIRAVPVDAAFAMQAGALEALMAADAAAGLAPACVVATVGTTSSTAVDPLRASAAACGRHGAWLHVDAAYAGAAAILPERRALFDGVELADSFVFNPHKWLLTNFDCSAYFVRDVPALLHTFAAAPAYLRTAHDPEVVNFRDWGIQLGRRFRALKLWFVIRSYGVEGLRAMLRRHIALAEEFRSWVEAEPGFVVPAPSPFGLVCLRHEPPALAGDGAALDDWNRALLSRVNAAGDVFLTHTQLGGRYTLRLAIGQWQTERANVARAWELIRSAAGAT
jgi:aromatic-L-amino-acid decarboxylase